MATWVLPIDPAGQGPWFRSHPRLAVAVAGALFAGVFALRVAARGTTDATTVLFVLPVSLIGIAFGLRAGAAAGALAVGLTVAWAAGAGVSFSTLGWAARVVPLLGLGPLIGAASDRLDEAHRHEEELAMMCEMQREAAELNDAVVQRLAVAKWMFESGQLEGGLRMLTETIVEAQALVAQLLGPDSLLPGDLSRSRLPERSHLSGVA
jgi:hypothetical protein